MGQLPLNGIVTSNDDTKVRAAYLTYRGAKVYEPDGTPYIAAEDFDFDNFVYRYMHLASQTQVTAFGGIGMYLATVAGILLYNFKTCGPDELQRAYNGERHYDGDGFVKAFTPVASFVYGVAADILRAPEAVCNAGGGAQNFFNKHLKWNGWDKPVGNPDVDISGYMWNNPNNTIHIRAGYVFADYYCHLWDAPQEPVSTNWQDCIGRD